MHAMYGHILTKEDEQGILQNGSVAVKKIFSNLNVEDKEFDREIQSMMQVKHPNVVRFIGYCSNTEHELMRKEGKYIKVEVRERLLCFEHISNGSLRSHITGMFIACIHLMTHTYTISTLE
jgi:serine/threonine protein kinase